MNGEYDPLDPYGVNQPAPEPPLASIPLKTQQFPWTDAEINDVRQFSKNWRGDHGITQGKEGDLEVAYQQLRMQGLGHDAARQGAINQLGWQGDTQQAPPTTTTTTPGPQAPTSNSTPFQGPTLADVSAPFQAPTPQALPEVPQFRAPTYTAPPAFRFGDFQSPGPFKAPSADDVFADPGYQFRKQQANDAFMGNRAASGTAHTGGTIKDFLDYNQKMASQEYGNVWNRDYSAYNSNFNNALMSYAANRGNALSNYNTNYQTQYQDPWNIADQSAQQEFAPQLLGYQTNAANTQHLNDQKNNDAWKDYLHRFDVFQGLFDDRYRVATA